MHDFINNFFEKLSEKMMIDVKCKIVIDIDEKNKKSELEVKGNKINVLTGLSLLIEALKKHGFSKDEILMAIAIGIEEAEESEE